MLDFARVYSNSPPARTVFFVPLAGGGAGCVHTQQQHNKRQVVKTFDARCALQGREVGTTILHLKCNLIISTVGCHSE